MIELFEQDLKTIDRQSSKGNQLKWKNNDIWYKADYTGYEGLVEYTISHLLKKSSLMPEEYIIYNIAEIKYKNRRFLGASSKDFLPKGWSVITLERLYKNVAGLSLYETIWNIIEPDDRLLALVEIVESLTGLKRFGEYMNKLLTIDALFLNEDRHFHNIAVLMNDKGEFKYCPIFDNGASLLADTLIEYPIGEDIYLLIDSVSSKTISTNFLEQMSISEVHYGNNLNLFFTKKDVESVLGLIDENEASIYPIEIRKRVRDVIFEQMRKYPYLFN